MKAVRETPRCEIKKILDIEIWTVNHLPASNMNIEKLNEVLKNVENYSLVSINETVNIIDRRRIHDFIDTIKTRELSSMCALFVHSIGGS